MSCSSLCNSRWTVTFALAASLAVASSSHADEIQVPSQQPTIQAGIDAAVNGDEVILADGTYAGAGNVNCTFDGKLITVRSASGNADACIVDCQDVASTRGFLFENGETSAAVLKDITITGATNNAIRCTNTSPVINGCRLVANNSSGGAGLFSSGGSPTLAGCLFYDNHATVSGGAATLSGSPIIHSCRFIGNSTSAGNSSGGALSLGGPAQVVNCLFHHNAAASGGAIAVNGPFPPDIINCTLVANLATGTAGGDTGGAIRVSGVSATVSNSIVYNNVPDQFFLGDSATIDVTYSNVEDEASGEGDIDDGPLFTDPLGPDDIAGTLDDDFSIRSFSPCADSGDNSAVPAGVLIDLAGDPRFADDPNSPDVGLGRSPLVDMGCYEFQPLAAPTCPTDLDGSGNVNGFDLALLLGAWGPCP